MDCAPRADQGRDRIEIFHRERYAAHPRRTGRQARLHRVSNLATQRLTPHCSSRHTLLTKPMRTCWDASGQVEFEALSPTVFIFFQTVFCATAATIVSGAMAERTKFSSYLIYTLVISLVIYPISGHWIWGGGFFIKNEDLLIMLVLLLFTQLVVGRINGGSCFRSTNGKI